MSETALLVIDAQIALLAEAWRADEIIAVIRDLQQRAREAGAPVIFLQHNHHDYRPLMRGEETWAIHPRLAPQSGDIVIEKTASDSFLGTTLHERLGRLRVRRLAITGLQTEFCVDATAREALSLGYQVTLAADARTTGDAVMPAELTIRHHNHALGNLAHPTLSIAVTDGAEVRFA